MRLFEELFENADDGVYGVKCVWKLGGEGYFEGVKGLTEFSPAEIRIHTRLGEVQVLGKGLSVKKYADGDLYVGGRIYTLTLATPSEGKC